MLLCTALAGLAIPAGALFACVERIQPRWLERDIRHSIIAFGGGALLAAVALVLVPGGVEALAWAPAAAAFLAGGVGFMVLDRAIRRLKGSASQLTAMLADFIPEALAMGAGFGSGDSTGALLALLIALQNLPESFNAYREIRRGFGTPGSRIILVFLAIALLGPLAGWIGYALLPKLPEVVGVIMLFAAGGILYLTFEDLAPQAKLSDRSGPALGAVVGFLSGMIGHTIIVGH